METPNKLELKHLTPYLPYGITPSTAQNKCGLVIFENNKGGFDIDSCKGIPLTPEWLIKFGFISERTGIYKEQWLLYKKDDLTLHWRNEFCEFGWVESIEIKYVHQLQNLYLSLTQQELTITT